MITLAVDAMGGDAGLSVTVPGAVAFLKQRTDARLIMVGDDALVREALTAANAPMERIDICRASQVVAMDEPPQLALKNKKDSSMRVAINQVKEGNAQAAVSAGNTGALMATARFVLKTIPGIERPAIAKFLPSADNHMTLMLDLGANVDCSADQLMQFAVIGSELFQALYPEKGRPRIGLLNVGTEEIKGTETIKQAFELLQSSSLNFVGNVEGNAVFSGEVDVVVADGFVGNVVLKTIEGAVKFLGGAIKHEFKASLFTKAAALVAFPALKGFKNKFDPRRFNGAIFLGLRGVVVKSHGGTDATGFAYALEEAYHEARADSLDKIEQGVASQLALLAEKRLENEQAVMADNIE
ncbi:MULTISPECIES: phosphate acyltransferase PlsX [unclassified Neisseria]|uniref:phosphate acyltransferase PlsX n=1 Tax=unclassified Neisseria TaxID=2623750 RepID=UPI002665EDC9|nr:MULTISPECIES: phosphate acyltransferase PlsX [unclassified Neisseria]MDO1510056.1 phosphate acyltransferase PlsX [Neisseria sp. MVDL19-042950]MDO1516914.1 phosphate acyltransferase PlsX [Neisseria sp. MVDL18-041461]MDO1564199.1 phosphate acyltransferase PlsX [Neisseria sp. MVDL20-010259]